MAVNFKELTKKIKGVVHVVMTPFDKDGDLDEKALRISVNHVAEALKGQDAVFLTTGSIGEFYAMTDEECKTVVRATTEELDGRFPLFAGTGRSGTRRTIELSQYAQQVGADGVMVLNPYYQPVTEEGLYRHFKTLADSIDIGIMLYNNPVMTKLWIDPPLMARLSKIDNIIADTETITDADKYYWMQRAVDPNDMAILCGMGQLVYPFFAVFHCPGFVTELANFAPEIAVAFYRAAVRRDFDRLVELIDSIASYYELRSKILQSRSPVPGILSPFLAASDFALAHSMIKEAMNLTGLPGGTVREPIERLTAEEIEQLKAVLKQMGVL